MVLMDRYDITNKAVVCDPSFNTKTLNRFRNCRDRLRVAPDYRMVDEPESEELESMDTSMPSLVQSSSFTSVASSSSAGSLGSAYSISAEVPLMSPTPSV